MTFDEWMLTKDKSYIPTDDSMSLRLLRECWFSRDAEIAELMQQLASRDAEIARLKTIPMRYRRMAFNAQLQDEIEELVAALKPFGAIDLVESRLPAEFAMLILRARAAIAKVRKP